MNTSIWGILLGIVRPRRCVLLVLALITAGGLKIVAQSRVDGAWQADSPTQGVPWTVSLKSDGSRIYGTVSACASREGVFEIFDGRVDGDSISFKCKSGDQRRT